MRTGPALRPSLLALATTLVLLIAAAPAGAVAFTSNTTTTSDPFFPIVNQDASTPTTFHVVGTSNLLNGSVDMRCYWGTSMTAVLVTLATDGSGNFEGDVPINGPTGPNLDQKTCVLRAVQASDSTDYPPGSPANASGPTIGAGEAGHAFWHGASPPAYDFNVFAAQLDGQWQYHGMSGCGIYFSYLVDPTTLFKSPALFYCNNALFSTNAGVTSGATRSELQVDGTNALLADAAHDANSTPSHEPEVTFTSTQNPATGAVTIHSTEDVVKCTPGGFPPSGSSCTDFVPTGVKVDVTYTQLNGHVTRAFDRFYGTDGQQHTIDALWDQEVEHDGMHGQTNFPWTGDGFRTYAEGDTVAAPPAGPGSIFVMNNSTLGDNNESNPRGAITFPTGPDHINWLTPSTSFSDEFVMHYARTIPANGSVYFGWTFSQAFAQSDVNSQAASAEAFYRPSVAITGPANGSSTSQSHVTVTGTASDSSGVSGVSVNGVSATVNGDGTWSADVPLNPGANTLTATVTNLFGTTATDSRSMTYNPPAAPIKAPAPPFLGVSLSKLVFVIDKHGRITIIVVCPPSAKGSCTGGVSLVSVQRFLQKAEAQAAKKGKKRAKVKLGHASFSIPAGKSGKVRVKISKAGLKLIAKRHKLAATVTITSKDASGAGKKTGTRITIKAPKKKKRH